MRALLPAFATHLAARAAADRTAVSYRRTVVAFLDRIGDREPVRADIETFLARPRVDGAPRAGSTKRAELMALRAFFAFAAGVDPTAGIRLKRERRTDPPVVMPNEAGPLYEAARRTAMPARNTAVIAVMHVLALRVHEVALLDSAQLDLSAGVLRNVRGKGGTLTTFVLPAPVLALLSTWLRERARMGHDDGPLFPTARPSSSRTGRLSIRSLQRLVRQLGYEAGLRRPIGPHALRHGCATAAISLGIDVPTTAECLRHSSIATTQSYVHLARDARRAAFERLATLIPPTVLPASTNGPSEPGNAPGNPPAEGVGAPVDIQPAMDDIPRPEHHGRASRKTGTMNTPAGACFGCASSRGEPPLVEGGPGGHALLEQLLAQHLAAVHALVDASVGALARDLREHGLALPRGDAGLRAGDPARVPLAPDGARLGRDRDHP